MRNSLGSCLLVSALLAAASATSVALGQVSNDECATATVVTPGIPAPFNTTTATGSANAAPNAAQCPGTFLDWGAAATNRDVWFSFTPAEPGLVDFSTCFITGFDTSMVVYTGTCGALTQLACNGDSPNAGGCQAFYSEITGLSVTAGATYYIRIGGWNGAEFGVGQLTTTFTPSAAACASAKGGCATVHATPGCADPNCCTAVCAANPICCEIGWDQSCVDAAVPTCGIFIHTCTAPNAAVANDCATNATVVSADSTLSFNLTGCNTDGPEHSTATCSSGNTVFLNDVWYRAKALANGTLRVFTCNQVTFDSKLAIYDMGLNAATFDYNTLPTALVACNDDGAGSCLVAGTTSPYASDLSINAVVNHWYLIRVATFDFPGAGPDQVTIDLPEPCALPPFTGTEAEPCGSATNEGCNAGGQAEAITLGSTVKGSLWAVADPTTGAVTRDTDFYRLVLTQDTALTVEVFAAAFVQSFILAGDPTVAACGGMDIVGLGSGNCPHTATACLPAGTYHLLVRANMTGIPCGSGTLNEYRMKVTGTAPAQPCPSFGDTCTYTLTGTQSQNNGVTITNYALPCLLFCGSAGTTFNVAADLARSFGGLTSGGIGCVTVGYANMDEQLDGTLIPSTLPTSGVRLALYRDLDGGAPTAVGVDLIEIAGKNFAVPGGVGTITWNLDTPLNLTGNTNNIVVMMSVPESVGQCTFATNGIVGGVGNNQGATAPWYLRNRDAFNICAPNNTFTAQAPGSEWIVQLGMVSVAPPCPTDFNGDGATGSADLSILLSAWGTSSTDLNGDGLVGSADLSILLSSWGPCP